MDDISRSVAHSVKSGSYFKDAREWYSGKYIAPITDRSILAIFTLVAAVAACVTLYVWISLYPVKKEVPLILRVKEMPDFNLVIKPLAKDLVYPQKSLAEYLIGHYVVKRESYNFDNRQKQLIHIKNASSKQVFKQFVTETSVNNPESPVLLYQRSVNRHIEIQAINFPGDLNNVNRAVVRFKATTEDIRVKDKTTTTHHQADIRFTLSDLFVAAKTKSIDFTVTSYSVKKH